MSLTIHFNSSPPEAIEQWLGTEARYIIGTFSKPATLQKIYSDYANRVIADCKQLGENIVGSITMILTSDMQKLDSTKVCLTNGDAFLLDDKYAVVGDAEAREAVDALIREDSPRAFMVINK
jgi:hypothetical protein